MSPRGRRRGGVSWLLVAVIVGAVTMNVWIARDILSDDPVVVDYTTLLVQVRENNVESLRVEGRRLEADLRRQVALPSPLGSLTGNITSIRPEFADDNLLAVLVGNGVPVNDVGEDSGDGGWLFTVLVTFGPVALIVLGALWLLRRTGGGTAGMTGFGRSRATRYERPGQRVTFNDVAGVDEAKEELREIVDVLRDPERYRSVGARAPRGVLLLGPPGTGKTLLARAVAGEADVPFFSQSASEFIEMIVGVGASRVRDLFERAKAEAPSIVFIDELDAIGRTRGGFAGLGGVDEREQTLNQILTEMDGFDPNQGVIVLAATNRPDVLDPALLRAGRFDRRVALNAPDHAGRRAILNVHARHVPLSEGFDLGDVASFTPGMVGADLANLVNEAALTAARVGRRTVGRDDFLAALERIVLGAERRITIPEHERRRTAYHEAGHALAGMVQEGADPVRKVSIIPRGRSLGVTYQSPSGDQYSVGEGYLLGRIIGALAGRAAELLVFGEATTGAEADLELATALARSMVGRWGMSPVVGPVSVLSADDPSPIGLPMAGASEAMRNLVDEEVRRIVVESLERAKDLLAEHRGRLDALAAALLDRETLDEADARRVAGLALVAEIPAVRGLGSRA